MTDSGRRLTSWKEIAAYFGREVRTVMRWEKERALPVRRGPNGRAGVVFADTAELDAWTRGAAMTEASAHDSPPLIPVTRAAMRRWTAGAAIVLALTAGLGGWRLRGSRASDQPDTVVMTKDAVVARSADGSEKWRHDFADTSAPPFALVNNPIEPFAGDGILAATSNTLRRDNSAIRSGQVMWFDAAGRLQRSFSFEDRLTIGSRAYDAPWSITDYRVDTTGGRRRIAVAAHHYEWWPAIVTILDDQWKRQGSFVHAGWVEHMRWLPENRLAIAGFSNLKDAGMVALLGAGAINGQSPSPLHGQFDCASCGPDRPLRYVVMPRSEVNRAAAAPFNRASLSVGPGTLVVRTVELPQTSTTTPANAIYEFTPQLHLVHATYSDRYWEAHRELQRLGKLTHTREQCPDRDGPRQIESWDPATGWTVQVLRQTISR